MCNLTFTYLGTTSAVPNVRSTSDTIDQTNVVGWGLLTAEMAGYGAYTKWWYNGSHFLIDADVVINTAYNWTLQNVESIMTHELGHFIGLNHSNVQASVMFANPYNSYSYQRTLRGDDACVGEDCRLVPDQRGLGPGPHPHLRRAQRRIERQHALRLRYW